MAAPSYQNLKNWDVDDVSRWLGQIHLSNLIPNFERIGITGSDIPQIDDRYIREHLRVVKPAEIATLKGALSTLVEVSHQSQQLVSPPRRKSALPRQPAEMDHQRTGSIDKQSSRTALVQGERKTPAGLPKNYTMPASVTGSVGGTAMAKSPQLINGSAPELLDDHVRYSGWIRKQGGGYKNWKRRYLILRLGCLYYFTNETASHPKGSFTLAGYTVSYCTDPKIKEKFKWTLKISPTNYSMRTYYISLGAKKEMECWKEAIDAEIESCKIRRVSSSPMGGAPFETAIANDDDDDDVDDEDDQMGNIYDDPDDEDHPYSQPDEEDRIYDQPDGDVDDPYSQIGDGSANFPPGHPQSLPSPNVGSAPLHVKNFRNIDEWEVTPENRLAGKGGAPLVPLRSIVSLQPSRTQTVGQGGPVASKPLVARVLEESEDTYLPIIGSGPSSDGGALSSPEHTRPSSPPVQDDSQKIMRGGHEIVLPSLEKREEGDYVDDSLPDDEDDSYQGDESDAYYIMFKRPDELMPPSSIFDRLDRADADRYMCTAFIIYV